MKYVQYWSQELTATTDRMHAKNFCQSVKKCCREEEREEKKMIEILLALQSNAKTVNSIVMQT